jgi:hypothetical protein
MDRAVCPLTQRRNGSVALGQGVDALDCWTQRLNELDFPFEVKKDYLNARSGHLEGQSVGCTAPWTMSDLHGRSSYLACKPSNSQRISNPQVVLWPRPLL